MNTRNVGAAVVIVLLVLASMFTAAARLNALHGGIVTGLGLFAWNGWKRATAGAGNVGGEG